MTSNNFDAVEFKQDGSCIIMMHKITFEQATKFVAYPVSLDGKSYPTFPTYEWMYLGIGEPIRIKKLLFKFEKITLNGPNFPYPKMTDIPGKAPIDMGPKKANVSFSFDSKFNEEIIRIWNYFELCFRAAHLMFKIGASTAYMALYPCYVKEAMTVDERGKKVKIENFYNFNFLLRDGRPEKNFFSEDENSDHIFEFYRSIKEGKTNIETKQYVEGALSFTVNGDMYAWFKLTPAMMAKDMRMDSKTKQLVPIDRIYLSPDFCMPKNGKVRLNVDTDKKKATTPEELAQMQTLKHWNIRINVAIPNKTTGNIQTIVSGGRGINLVNLTPEIRAETGKVDTTVFEHKNMWMKLIQSNPEFKKLPVIVGNKSELEKNMFIGCCTMSFSSVGVGSGVSKSHFMIEELCAIPGTIEVGNQGTITGDTMDLGDEPFSSEEEDTGLDFTE